jgi:hypothetical protein
MAIDNTPPRLKLIATIAILTITTLVCLDFAFKSYYAYMSDEAIREKLMPAADLEEQRKVEATSLTNAKIDQVVGQLGKGARPDSITPTQSEDLGPMTGWAKMPKPAPTPNPTHAPVAPVMEVLGDAGAAADAGPAAKPDAGAPKPRAADAGANH